MSPTSNFGHQQSDYKVTSRFKHKLLSKPDAMWNLYMVIRKANLFWEHLKSFKSIPIYSVCSLTFGLCNFKTRIVKTKKTYETVSLEIPGIKWKIWPSAHQKICHIIWPIFLGIDMHDFRGNFQTCKTIHFKMTTFLLNCNEQFTLFSFMFDNYLKNCSRILKNNQKHTCLCHAVIHSLP